ncbi:hypothetical protein [Roseivirga sp.]|uniref:hypothetical protein n=1 Tax=Roseivirga sp. TaxID=1964215 RepID=UPI003B8B3E42
MKRFRIILVYIVVVFTLLEGGLRLLGVRPPLPQKAYSASKTHLPDSLIGWKPNPGLHNMTLNRFGDNFEFTIGEDFGRITKPLGSISSEPSIQLIGGSFFFGAGVNDSETCAWKLQERFPEKNFLNYSIGAQGTYQALLGLERRLNSGQKIESVIYGFISNHKRRNIASHEWLEMFYYNKNMMTVEVPYVALDKKGKIKRQKPTSLTSLPFSEYSATMYLMQKILNKTLAYDREQDEDEILSSLINQMKDLCDKQGIDFYVAVLYYENNQKGVLDDFFEKNGIQYINCNIPLNEKNTIKDDGHPIAEVHEVWANRISERLIRDGH